MDYLVDNVGEILPIHNKPEDIKVIIAQINRKDYTTKLALTEKGERFYRLVTRSQITKNQIHPTTDNGHYFNYYLDYDGDFFGYFTGDKDEWLKILIHDGFLDSSQDIFEVEIEFPEGTPYFSGKRNVNMQYSDELVDEFFIVYDKSVSIINKVKISDDEIGEAEQWLADQYDDPFEENDEKENEEEY